MIIYPEFIQQFTLQRYEEFLRSHGIYKSNDDNGIEEFGSKTWIPSLKQMKKYNYIDCGYDLFDQTISFAVIMNRIYQFKLSTYPTHYEPPYYASYVDVIIYDDVHERYSKKDHLLHVFNGYRLGVDQIVPEINDLGNFQKRLSHLIYAFQDERKKRLLITLVWKKYISFTLAIRLLLCCDRLWMASEFHSRLDGYSTDYFHYNYHALKPTQFFQQIPISFGNQTLNIVWEFDTEYIKIIDFNITTHLSSLCFGQQTNETLTQIKATEICHYQNLDYDITTKTLIEFFQAFSYGFKMITDLILVSNTKNLVLIVDENLLLTHYKEYPYEIKNAEDFFVCYRKTK